MRLDLLLRRARIDDQQSLLDIGITEGRIRLLEADVSTPAERVLDVGGRVVIPGFVEPHVHLDKALTSERTVNTSGTLAEAIQVTSAAKPGFSRADIRARAEAALRLCVRHGVTALRAETEFDPLIGLLGLEVLLELKSAYASLVDIQVVAFPQEGIHKTPGTLDLFHEAMRMGADVVGGVPYNDRDAREHIDSCFALAQQYDRPLSLHQDFSDDATSLSVEYVAQATIAAGMQGRVEIGHATALGALPPERLAEVAGMLRSADISVITLPLTDLHLGGRTDSHLVRRALTPVRALLAAGVNVAPGANNIRNAFSPFGNGDPLLTAYVLAPAAHLGGADTLPLVLDLVTRNAARAIGRSEDSGIRIGACADLVVLDTLRYADAFLDLPERTWVVKSGQVTVSNRTERWQAEPAARQN